MSLVNFASEVSLPKIIFLADVINVPIVKRPGNSPENQVKTVGLLMPKNQVKRVWPLAATEKMFHVKHPAIVKKVEN
jgi:hypothetical protein